jgi:hypothetical protein
LPLSKRARIEIYLPSGAKFGRLKTVLEREFRYTFGGCTAVVGIKGQYLYASGESRSEAIDLLYSDTPFDFNANLAALTEYTDRLKSLALRLTAEESILIVVHEIYHSN